MPSGVSRIKCQVFSRSAADFDPQPKSIGQGLSVEEIGPVTLPNRATSTSAFKQLGHTSKAISATFINPFALVATAPLGSRQLGG
jgi:hypothetical protein